MISVAVIEPYALLRTGILQQLAEVAPETQLTGADYTALDKLANSAPSTDLVLLSAPFHEGVNPLIAAARRIYTPKCVILLSDTETMPHTWRDLPPVIAGYIPKTASPELLLASVRLVLAGGKCFQASHEVKDGEAEPAATPDHETSQNTSQTLIGIPAATMAAEARSLHITPRQYEVLVLLSRGYPVKAISRLLNISTATIKAHAETLYQRLDAHNRNEAVYAAISRGATLGWQRLSSPEKPRINS